MRRGEKRTDDHELLHWVQQAVGSMTGSSDTKSVASTKTDLMVRHFWHSCCQFFLILMPIPRNAACETRRRRGEEAAAEAGSIFGSQDRASLWFACVLSLKLFSSYDLSLVTPVSLVHPLHSLTRSLLKYRCIS